MSWPRQVRLPRRTTALAAAMVVLLALGGHTATAAAAVPARTVLLATTTTTVPDTTTTTVPPTTTTVAPTTTTTAPAKASKNSSVPLALIGVIIVVLLLIVLMIALMVSRKGKTALDAWRRRALPALSDARLAREALLSPSAVSDDVELRGAVSVQAEKAAVALEQAARTAPDPAAGGSATTAAGALRGLAFSIEADRLLRNGAAAPTGVQLAQADEARRDRDAELQGALARLQAHVSSPSDRP